MRRASRVPPGVPVGVGDLRWVPVQGDAQGSDVQPEVAKGVAAGLKLFNTSRDEPQVLAAPFPWIGARCALRQAPQPTPDPGGGAAFQQDLPNRIVQDQ